MRALSTSTAGQLASESAVTAEMPYPSLSGRTQISAPGSFQPSTRDMCRAQADCAYRCVARASTAVPQSRLVARRRGAMTVSFERPSSSFERLHAALIFSLTGAMALSASPPSFAAFLRHSSTWGARGARAHCGGGGDGWRRQSARAGEAASKRTAARKGGDGGSARGEGERAGGGGGAPRRRP